MGDNEAEPRLFTNRFADAVGPAGGVSGRDRCQCVGYSVKTRPACAKDGYRPRPRGDWSR
jgi:hypothetical protein